MTSQQPKRVYAVFLQDDEDQDKLPDQFQGLHPMAACPLFKGGGCPNCLGEMPSESEAELTEYEHRVVTLRNYLLNEKGKISNVERTLLYALEAVATFVLKLDEPPNWTKKCEVRIVKKQKNAKRR